MKQFIKNNNIKDSENLFASIGEKSYRARQLYSWLYEKNVNSFQEMTNFSKDLRRSLDEKFSIHALELADHVRSGLDGTEKFLFKTHDDHFIESVLIRNEGDDEGRLTVCISSQVGCAMGCSFCETARLGFTRDLEPAEILDQLCHVRRVTGQRNNNIVFMGMGEPLKNYDNVLKAADIMNYTFGFHISSRKITISTCGVLDGIERFIDEERPYNLAISLNDTVPEKRKSIMPVENKHPFVEITKLLRKKLPVSHNRLTIVYIMRNDNITLNDARRLKNMFNYDRIKLNLIPLNRGSHRYKIPDESSVNEFVKELEIMNVPYTIRKSFGEDISGACGQLAGKRIANDCAKTEKKSVTDHKTVNRKQHKSSA